MPDFIANISHPLAQMAEGLSIASPTALQVGVTSAGAVDSEVTNLNHFSSSTIAFRTPQRVHTQAANYLGSDSDGPLSETSTNPQESD